MTNVYSTVPTNWLLAAEQAFAAGGAAINLGGGTLKVGDGNGAVPTAAAIIANGGVLHQVWQGPVNGGAVDASNALQINVNCLIPTVDGSGTEIGPFTVREFAIYDAGGNLALVGTTNLEKTTSALGQLMTLQWYACYAGSIANSVTVQPPAGSFPTLGMIQTAIANLLSAAAPLSLVKTLLSSGWTSWALSIANASQPVDPVTEAKDIAALGVTRAASAAEFAAGAPAAASNFKFPFPTLQQTTAAIAAVPTSGRLLNVRVFDISQTYTPTPGTNFVIVGAQGAGASGGSCAGPNNGSLAGLSYGGSAGAYGLGRFTSGFSGVTITVGGGGLPSPAGNNAGNDGGDSSFGSLLVAPGGVAGLAGGAVTPPTILGGGNSSAAATGANLFSTLGAPASPGIALSSTTGQPARGGGSHLGAGGQTLANSGGSPGFGPGAGGSGVFLFGADTTGAQGGAGKDGEVTVWEFA
jgi:hypothetical protein